MCGIFGIFNAAQDKLPDLDCLKQSSDLLSHRGPDGHGIFQEAGIGLVHSRLSLVDLHSRSDQPFHDPSGRYVLVYNGEIYNFRELRKELEGVGKAFHTESDTEVLLVALVTWGIEQTLEKLEGMFAFALFDREERLLTLARDRFGIKPLLFYYDGNTAAFASEAKAFEPWFDLRPAPSSVSAFFLGYGHPAKGLSLFENIQIVPPGTYIRISGNQHPDFTSYRTLADSICAERTKEHDELTPSQAVDRLDELLNDSVRSMLMADAPIGALCSGGVDSSVIMAVAARYHPDLKIFHANIVGKLSEYPAAKELSDHLKLEMKKVDVQDGDFIDFLPAAIRHYEMPILKHRHSVPFMMVSQLVADNGVKGVLSGEASDECFLGYPHLVQEPILDRYRAAQLKLGKVVRRIPHIGNLIWPDDALTMDMAMQIFTGFERGLEHAESRAKFKSVMGRSPDRNIRTIDMMGYHLRTLLHRNDTMGMAASLEARFPFLHEPLVDFAINLPRRFKIRMTGHWNRSHPFFRDKWIIRQVADRYLPKSLSQRKKWPFRVDAFGRMKIPTTYFHDSYASEYFGLQNGQIEYLMEKADQNTKLRFLMFDVWGRMFMQKQTKDSVAASLQKHLSVTPAA